MKVETDNLQNNGNAFNTVAISLFCSITHMHYSASLCTQR